VIGSPGLPPARYACVLAVAFAACSSSSPQAARPDGQSGPGPGSTGDCPEFWKQLEINANWVEYFPTMKELAQGADVVAWGAFRAAQPGVRVQGDAPEDSYTEILLSLGPNIEVLRGAAPPEGIALTIVPGARDVTAGTLSECIPDSPVLVFARRRGDRDAYRPVNDFGLWAKTPRAAIDTPLSPDPPATSLYRNELLHYSSLEELASAVRTFVSGP
jgi:hypothetical protein